MEINSDLIIKDTGTDLKTVQSDLVQAKSDIGTIQQTIIPMFSKPVLLWKNPNMTGGIGAATLTLSSSDWDMLEIFFVDWTGSANNRQVISTKVMKGGNAKLQCIFTANSGKIYGGERVVTYVNQTTINISTGYTMIDKSAFKSSATATDDWMVPIYIIGYKTGISW